MKLHHWILAGAAFVLLLAALTLEVYGAVALRGDPLPGGRRFLPVEAP